MKGRYLVVVWAFSVLSATGFGQEEAFDHGSQTNAVSQKLKHQLSHLLPDEGRLDLQPDGPIEFYGDNLYEYIDGAAGAFDDYDFVALVHRYYRKGGVELTVDIYDMGEKLNAFGIYTAESSPQVNPIEVGALGYLEKGILNFFQARYYVKLNAFSKTDSNLAPILKDIAGDISRRIDVKGGKQLPTVLRLLPSRRQVPQSWAYKKRDPLGFAFLSPTVIAKYEYGDSPTTVLLSLAESRASAQKRIDQLREEISRNGVVQKESAIGNGAFSGEDKYRGKILGFACHTVAVIFLDAPKEREKLISEMQTSIFDYSKRQTLLPADPGEKEAGDVGLKSEEIRSD